MQRHRRTSLPTFEEKCTHLCCVERTASSFDDGWEEMKRADSTRPEHASRRSHDKIMNSNHHNKNPDSFNVLYVTTSDKLTYDDQIVRSVCCMVVARKLHTVFASSRRSARESDKQAEEDVAVEPFAFNLNTKSLQCGGPITASLKSLTNGLTR